MIIKKSDFEFILIQYWNKRFYKQSTSENAEVIKQQLTDSVDGNKNLFLLLRSLSILCKDQDEKFIVPDLSELQEVFSELNLNNLLCSASLFRNVLQECFDCDTQNINHVARYKRIFDLIENDNSTFSYVCMATMIHAIVNTGHYEDNNFILKLVQTYSAAPEDFEANIPEWLFKLFV